MQSAGNDWTKDTNWEGYMQGLVKRGELKKREGFTLTFVKPGTPGLKERAEAQRKARERWEKEQEEAKNPDQK
jgi:hypothetical protein